MIINFGDSERSGWCLTAEPTGAAGRPPAAEIRCRSRHPHLPESAHALSPRVGAPRPVGVEREEPVHRLVRRRPHRRGRGRGRPGPAATWPRPGCCPTSSTPPLQTRAIRTAQLALDEIDRLWIPVRRSWRLNERHYGALQGLDKAETEREVRRRAVQDLAAVLRRPAAAAGARRRAPRPVRPPLRVAAARRHPGVGVPEGRARADAAVVVRRHRPRSAAPAPPCWWPPTATACGPW